MYIPYTHIGLYIHTELYIHESPRTPTIAIQLITLMQSTKTALQFVLHHACPAVPNVKPDRLASFSLKK